jgi:hypothetical protein
LTANPAVSYIAKRMSKKVCQLRHLLRLKILSMLTYSTKKITQQLLDDLKTALKSIDSYGSVEVYVQDSIVTQISVRNIRKTNSKIFAKVKT